MWLRGLYCQCVEETLPVYCIFTKHSTHECVAIDRLLLDRFYSESIRAGSCSVHSKQGRRKHFSIGMAKIISYHGLTMEGPKVPNEARSAGAPRGMESGSPVWGSGGYAPRKFFKKSKLKLHIFNIFAS